MLKESKCHSDVNLDFLSDDQEQSPPASRQPQPSFTDAFPTEIWQELFPFLDRQTLVETGRAFPRAGGIMEHPATYQALIRKYFPFLQRTQPKEYKENPQQLYQNTFDKLFKSIPLKGISNEVIIEALDGNFEPFHACITARRKEASGTLWDQIFSYFVKDEVKEYELNELNNVLQVLIVMHQYRQFKKLDKHSLTINQISLLQHLAIFFDDLELLKVICRTYHTHSNMLQLRYDISRACMYGHADILTWLLEILEEDTKKAGTDMNFRFTEINIEALKAIINHLKINQATLDELLIRQAGTKNGCECIKYLLSLPEEHCSFSQQIYLESLEKAFRKGNMENVDLLLECNQYANAPAMQHLSAELLAYIHAKKLIKPEPMLKGFEGENQKRKFEQQDEQEYKQQKRPKR